MSHHNEHIDYNLTEKYSIDSKTKNGILGFIGLGAVLVLLGIFLVMNGWHGADAHAGGGHGEHAEHAGRATTWISRLWANLLLNNAYFIGFGILSVFILAFSTITQSSWYIVVRRVPEAFSKSLYIFIPLFAVVAIVGMHDLWIWSNHEALAADHHHVVIQKKVDSGFLTPMSFIIRMVVIFALWLFFQHKIVSLSEQEDKNGGTGYLEKATLFSTIFIFVFGLTFSLGSWDWLMSIEPAWFSTMFSVYVFANCIVGTFAMITIYVIYLKWKGYMNYVNDYHVHDLGKFVFAFSVFWTYIWFCEFLLIWYSNIPEETFYFAERLNDPLFSTIFFTKFILNFFVPFFALMTRDAKRDFSWLFKISIVVLIGHWLDFYLMIMPGVVGPTNAGIGPLEIGMTLLYFGIFSFFVTNQLSKQYLCPQQHPYLEESLHHSFI